MSLSHRDNFHGTLPFSPDLIDEVLASISPTDPESCGFPPTDVPLWDVSTVKLALAARCGLKAGYFDAADVEFIEEPGDVEAIEAELDARIAAAQQRLADYEPGADADAE